MLINIFWIILIKIDNKLIYARALMVTKTYKVIFLMRESTECLIRMISAINVILLVFSFYIVLWKNSAIPREWRLNLHATNEINDNAKRLTMFISHAHDNKVVYFIKQKTLKATAISNMNLTAVHRILGQIFSPSSLKLLETSKFNSFSFFYVHRIIGCNEFLFKIKKERFSSLYLVWGSPLSLDHFFRTYNITTYFGKIFHQKCLKSDLSLNQDQVNFGLVHEASFCNFLTFNWREHFFGKQKLKVTTA